MSLSLSVYPAPAPVPAQNTPAQASPTQFEFAIPPLAPVFQATSTPAPAPPILHYFLCQLNIILPQLRVPHQLKLLLPELGLPSHLWLLFFRPHQLQLLPPKLSLTSQLSLPQPLPSNQNKISIVIWRKIHQRRREKHQRRTVLRNGLSKRTL